MADGAELPFPAETFDTAVSFETVEHVQDPGGFLDEISRVLRPGGRALDSDRHHIRPDIVPGEDVAMRSTSRLRGGVDDQPQAQQAAQVAVDATIAPPEPVGEATATRAAAVFAHLTVAPVRALVLQPYLAKSP